MQRFDVLVVGGRCAGAAAAMLMARRGLRVLAVDRGGYGTDTLSTHALMRGAVMLLHRWGVLPRLIEAGTPPIRRTTFHYGTEAVAVDLRPGDGVDALIAPRRTLLDSVLVDAAWEAGAELRHHHSVTGLLRDAGGRVTGAMVVDEAGQEYAVAAGLVVGADGVGSTVARLAGAPVMETARHAAAVVYGYWPGLADTGTHWHYGIGASAGRIPTNAGRHCVFASVSADHARVEMRGNRLHAMHRILREVSPSLAEEVAASAPDDALVAFAGRRGFLRQAAGPGWALIGDAGYFKDPITAHGITDALRDAALLAEAATEGTDAAFARFAARRDDLSLPLFRVTDEIASYRWTLEEAKAMHLALNTAMKREVAALAAEPVP
ncbi:NAD(P)/FAD-dependent oxidoreductase [Roseomonas eburnea]|uniref:NAD(P)/FAD-dependent oxidoreductase n=1 Tax=Neoroseomonas eburnea TaxID=1346889 RepID=A0A9X9XE41_9PROT|nr:FAD-dependent monooxygenase [Neoroseomonas eburnea]MBR0681977.1 NAD(P)/FAD-dependent oxidoreductase [Neoroseomonas eburnea]